ncbi:Swarming motility regulation protein RssB [Thalassocella blandensis]|nr:Swarming motility regulation protein RssB [Thalassocella blandensis]
MNRILLVEDNERLSSLISTAMRQVGIEIDVFNDIASAMQAIKSYEYSLLILDRGLPDGDGLKLLRNLRGADVTLACIVLTASNAIHDRIQGLESGADDYLAKPFSMDELIARVRAILRRPPVIRTLRPEWGDLLLVPETASIQCHNQLTSLSPSEIQILYTLMEAKGNTVRRSKLENSAWGYGEAVTPNALDVALHRIRKKLNSIHSKVELINVRGIGYALSTTEVTP